ncbi:hypothetical protein L596_019739 [Steinernema carpocapsae]|uniref:G-protein coupled receptors family 1 profile domain-containing protein n=1 Tax=Steinernema carpocapsae TaxID=34508 RepID=A0A4V6XVZ3_STECR|nr:hypothetical protein L596_019739 [Steinernema carpocapsae]
MFFSVVICSLGIAFNVLLARHQTVFNTGSNQKLNSFTRNVSFLRIFLEFLPYMADIVLSGFGMRFALVIGLFGAMASSINLLLPCESLKRLNVKHQKHQFEVKMQLTLVIIEHSVAILLASISVVVLAIALARKPPTLVWKDSPVLLCLLLFTLVCANAAILVEIEWLLVTISAIPNKSEYTAFLHFSGVAVLNIVWFYDSATVGVLVQRICFLICPLKPARSYSHIIVVIAMGVPLVCSLVYIAFNLYAAPLNNVPVKTGCMSMNCMTSHTQLIQLLGTIIKMFFSILIFSLGIAFNVLLSRHHTLFNTLSNQKLNSFTRHVSFLRIFLEILPYLTDIILSGFGIRLAAIIGPFGAIGSSIDFLLLALLYYKFVRKTRKRVTSKSRSEC